MGAGTGKEKRKVEKDEEKDGVQRNMGNVLEKGK